MSSDDDASDLMAAFKKGAPKGAPKGAVTQAPGRASRQAPPPRKQASFSPGQFISDDESREGDIPPTTRVRKVVAVRAAPVRNRSEYTYYEPEDAVEHIVREFQRRGDIMYEVKLTNGRTQQVSLRSFTPASAVKEPATEAVVPLYMGSFDAHISRSTSPSLQSL
jgi:chromodomain-helicase-DNA-binding protein 4